jgi:hypothetical protein
VARSWLGAALLALAVGVATLSLLGPLVSGVIDYRITDLTTRRCRQPRWRS